jgi:hypothetical protein
MVISQFDNFPVDGHPSACTREIQLVVQTLEQDKDSIQISFIKANPDTRFAGVDQ